MKLKITLFILSGLLFQSCIRQQVTQNEVFNPTKEYELNDQFTFERFFIKNSDTTELESWYMTEKNAEINLIYLSGNSSNIRSAIPFFNELGNQLDLNIFSFNYRGFGLSDGTPSIDGIIEDGNIALDYYKTKIGNKDLPTVLLGYSLGGFVALNVANNHVVDKAILMSTFTSLKELEEYLIKEALPGIVRPFLKLDIDESIYDLDNTVLVKQNTKPILFIHGEADDFIPSSMSYKLYNLSPSENKSIKTIPNADHRMVLKDNSINRIVIEEIKTFLKIPN